MITNQSRSSYAKWQTPTAKPASKLLGQFPVSVAGRVLAAPKKFADLGLPFDRPKPQKDFIHFWRPFKTYRAILCVR